MGKLGFEPRLLSSDSVLQTLDQGPSPLRPGPWFEGMGEGEEEEGSG